MAAEACLTYLNFRQGRGFSPALRSILLTNMIVITRDAC